ncbi:large conductance mechanosensitive channel protein MscL [Crocinitomicaceae bacterium CZZ-1]|uniref:Large-conductance mechanosensitive channel n=1 Tax=Taishania pollutisoli TaxID=2766479 RepID=A0A8J6PD11_9FLAO|nr:large conductance mechanosensitive channel protein MscL [Taishania pollutisoli]MBC9812807.1 large conductance mechanosensitive channel protein MscL [Taishania pollutisoli]MBX2949742.1 large conductance mechanosensitive channel protein MscL [Crocinitomicaceae bacterium]NGF76162.1 large conductance mechanosensitive channel protein MscL [Fluviicola sp. SGL-29]
MLKEFKAFILRGNVIDLAVAVVIGAAFNAIVSSLVADIITPLILNPAMKAAGAEKLDGLAWNGALYGKFIATVINFLVVAFVLFIVVKMMNRLQNMRKKEETVEAPAAPAPTKDQELLTEIRDLLKKQ